MVRFRWLLTILCFVSAFAATQTAAFDFGSFGGVLRAEGTGASSCPIRFSTKYQDLETDLLYYGYRYYNASTGRWLGRDPIEEGDGPNVYAFVGNDPIGAVDSDGRIIFKPQAEMQRYIARQLNSYAARSRSPLLGGAAGTLASLYEASANMIDPSLSDYIDRTVRRYDNAGRVYDRELGPCGEGKLWAAYAASAYFLGDYFGLNGLPEGIYGVDLITEESLSTSERWSRGLSGLSSSILFTVPAASRLSAGNNVVTLDPSAIRFSQSNVRNSLPEITQSMKANGWKGRPIDVVRMPDGALTAVDNTRLAAAALSKTPVRARIRSFDEAFPATRAGGNLQGGTWGEAVLNRIRDQTPRWHRRYPTGSPFTGVHPSTPEFSP